MDEAPAVLTLGPQMAALKMGKRSYWDRCQTDERNC